MIANGTKLRNGAMVIASRDGQYDGPMVLCVAGGEYVSWYARKADDGQYDAVWGHYYGKDTTLSDAMERFKAR